MNVKEKFNYFVSFNFFPILVSIVLTLIFMDCNNIKFKKMKIEIDTDFNPEILVYNTVLALEEYDYQLIFFYFIIVLCLLILINFIYSRIQKLEDQEKTEHIYYNYKNLFTLIYITISVIICFFIIGKYMEYYYRGESSNDYYGNHINGEIAPLHHSNIGLEIYLYKSITIPYLSTLILLVILLIIDPLYLMFRDRVRNNMY